MITQKTPTRISTQQIAPTKQTIIATIQNIWTMQSITQKIIQQTSKIANGNTENVNTPTENINSNIANGNTEIANTPKKTLTITTTSQQITYQ